MRPLILTIATVCALCTTASAQDKTPSKDEEKFQGVWRLASAEINGKQVPEEAIKEGRMAVKDDKYTFLLEDTILEVKYKFDSAKKPKLIDITFQDSQHKAQTAHGIYEIVEDTFKICRPLELRKERPTKFAARPNSNLMLLVWKRDKTVAPGKPEKVSGAVTLDGKPLERVTVKFVPAGAAGPTATGVTDAKGRFQATTFGKGDGLLPGEYKITVTYPSTQTKGDKTDPEAAALKRLLEKAPKSKTQRSRLPSAFGNLVTTPLRFEMKSEPGELSLNLQTK